MRAIVGLRMTLTLAGVAAALVFASAIGYPAVLVAGTCLAGIGLLVGSVQKALTIPMTSSLRLGSVAGVQLVELSALVAFVTLLVLAGAGIAPFFAIYLVSGLVALVATIAMTGWTMPLPAVDSVLGDRSCATCCRTELRWRSTPPASCDRNAFLGH